ncbi:hypothetical protein SAMN04515671_0376 [Nakamurella panacisegetis]|uniref:Uncharacterized protein n=1 Tax=Nakamurella panacisegetis TaxID=1090615 RepID=A0A1H0I6X7_9ACTN|nr:hypothetical protein [Nakamurella panacisegetis]SDO26871.1 hypothetical protein SAMN04515671_0376 [Nakamurella panacisegetis]
MRVYIPVTFSGLRTVVTEREVRPQGGIVFGVTDDLRQEYADADDEELEYLALSDAARACLRLLAAAPADEPPMRVVIAADVTDAESIPHRDRAAARVAGPVPWKQIASFHVDGAEAGDVVRAAVDVIYEADLGDDDAEFAVGSAQDMDLAWYAPGEIAYLIEDLDSSG